MLTAHTIRPWLIAGALIACLAFAFQGSRGLWEPDEGRYVSCAFEMVKTGDLLTPSIDGVPHFTKPPLAYWIVDAGLKLLGRNEWGARIFHGLAFFLTAFIVGFLGVRLWGHATGMAASLVYATMVMPCAAGNIVTTDTILALFETLAVFCFWMSIREKKDRWGTYVWTMLMCGCFGCAFLTKGPPGLIPLAAIIPYLILKKSARPGATPLLCGFCCFCLIALPWFFMVCLRHEGLLGYFLRHEFFGRVALDEHSRNPGFMGIIEVYVPALLYGSLPWLCCWPLVLRRAITSCRRSGGREFLRKRPEVMFLLLWVAIPLLVFFCAQSRLPLYLLPVFAPLALLTARGLTSCCPQKTCGILTFNRMPLNFIIGLVIVLVCIKAAAAYIPVVRDSRAMWQGIQPIIREKIKDSPYEIVLVENNYNGLAFYSDAEVEYVKLLDQKKPTFIAWKQAQKKIAEIAAGAGKRSHVFLVREKNHENRQIVSMAQAMNLAVEVAQAPFHYKLIFIERVR